MTGCNLCLRSKHKTKTWVQNVESGTTRVGYTDLKAWCGACGTTLSQFIGDLAGL